MIHLIINLRKSAQWWRVRWQHRGEDKQHAFILPLLRDWLRSLLKRTP